MAKQNEIIKNFLKGSDLGDREKEVLAEVSEKLDLEPIKLLSRSAWWGSKEIGAFHYLVKFQGKKAVLKIQGVKPAISEIFMIQSFAETNQSKLIRPPKLYAFLEWNEEKRYEALVLEHIEGEKIIKFPATQVQVNEFFQIYEDYRANCLNQPWLEKPDEALSKGIENNFKHWREISFKIYPAHPLREDSDEDLIDEAVEVLVKGYQGIEAQFMHGHFSAIDLYKVGDQVVILSNLFWGYRAPLYDAVFAYHWFIYQLNDIKGITPEEVEEQRSLWLDRIKSLSQAKESPGLLNLALLERAAAGLNLDALSADPNKPITKYLFMATRKIIKELIEKLSSSF